MLQLLVASGRKFLDEFFLHLINGTERCNKDKLIFKKENRGGCLRTLSYWCNLQAQERVEMEKTTKLSVRRTDNYKVQVLIVRVINSIITHIDVHIVCPFIRLFTRLPIFLAS